MSLSPSQMVPPGEGEKYDSRIFTVCAPWNGERGARYVQVFKPAFLNGLEAFTDDYATLREHLQGIDPGGNHNNINLHNGHLTLPPSELDHLL